MNEFFVTQHPNFTDITYLVEKGSAELVGQDYENAFNSLAPLGAEVFRQIGSTKTVFDRRKIWTGQYSPSSILPMHHYAGRDSMLFSSDYTGILVLETGSYIEYLDINRGKEVLRLTLSTGDLIVISHNLIRGWPRINEKLFLLLFEIKS